MSEVVVPEYLDSFDKVLVSRVLPALGVTSTAILALVLLAFSVKSWTDGIRDTVRLGTRGYEAARGLSQSLGTAGVLVASLVTAPVIVAELLVGALVFVLGNFMSIFVDFLRVNGELQEAPGAAAKLEVFEDAWRIDGITGWLTLPVTGKLDLDIPAVLTMLVAGLGMLGAFRSRRRSLRSSASWGIIIALPASFYFLLVGPIFVFAFAISSLFAGELALPSSGVQAEIFTAVVISGLYYAIMVLAAGGLQVASAAWTGTRLRGAA